MVVIIFAFLIFFLSLLSSLFCSRTVAGTARLLIDSGEGRSYIVYRWFCVSLSSRNFHRIVFLCSLRKPIGSHWFESVLLQLFSLQLWLFFFHKMMKFYKVIRTSFSYINVKKRHKNTIQTSSIYWNVLVFGGFFQTVWLLTGIPQILYLSFKKIT